MSKTTTTQTTVSVTEKFSNPKQLLDGTWFYTRFIPTEAYAISEAFATYEEACADIVKSIFAEGGRHMSVTYEVAE